MPMLILSGLIIFSLFLGRVYMKSVKEILVAYKITVTIIIAILIVVGGLAWLFSAPEQELEVSPSRPRVVDHTGLWREANITRYEGSKTCIQCHRDEVYEFFHSYHYQMANMVYDVAGAGDGVLVGGKYVYNDFCGSIFWRGNKSINYIGKAVLKRAPEGYEDKLGALIATGCSMCHGVSMGLIPGPEPAEEQLGNIDCLACHADPRVYVSGPKAIKKGWKEVYKDEDGVWRYRVNISADVLAASIIDKPASENCLACHAYSGGGPHFKRPNISPDMYRPEGFDIHLEKGLSCIDCHKSIDHAFPTEAADTWSREEGHAPSCTDCHGERPHEGLKGAVINRFHVEKIACQTCHIPYIAHGEYPTDVHRNWKEAEFLPDKAKWEPKLDLKNDVTPVYAWYNGTREVYLWPQPAEPENGTIYYIKPLGSRDDPNSKIYPFKLHAAIVPYSSANKTLVPAKVGIVFATGNVTKAVQVGAEISGMKWDGQWVKLVRYMQVNHGVRPASEALECLDCHGPTIRRMPWPELGYGRYPEIAFTSISIAAAALVVIAAYKLLRRRKA